jgi:hypothetical protein
MERELDIVSKIFGEKPVEPVVDGVIQFGPGKGLRKMVFQGLNNTGAMVKKIATIDILKAKIILIQPGEESLYASGIREDGISGYIYLFAHASPNSIQGMNNGGLIADVIRASGIWNGEPILIDACNAGAKISASIASQLAFSLKTYVTAPTTMTWNYPFGGPAMGQGAFPALPGVLAKIPIPDMSNPGHWRTWGPDGNLTGSAKTSPRDRGTQLPHGVARELLRK